LRDPARPVTVPHPRDPAPGDLVVLPRRVSLLLPEGVPGSRDDPQCTARAGRRLARDAVPGDTGGRGDEAGADRVRLPRRRDLAHVAAGVQRRRESRDHDLQLRHRRDRDRADGTHALVQQAARIGAQRRADGVKFASVYPLVTARAVAREFTYEVPDDVGVGAIVRVPFGRSRARGIVVALQDAAPAGVDVRPIEAVVGEIPATLVELALWIADYYGSTPARALALVAPETPKRRKE